MTLSAEGLYEGIECLKISKVNLTECLLHTCTEANIRLGRQSIFVISKKMKWNLVGVK